MSNATPLNKDNFKQITAADVTLVDFWAEWCAPCRMIAPVLDELAAEFEGRATVGKVNVDEASELAQEFGVSSIPTLIIMKNGEEVKRFVGVTSKDDLSQALEEAIG
jgi:thioredoxin 1